MSEFNRIHDEEGWIEWHGGACPVSGETKVDVRYRHPSPASFKSGMQADEYYWRHDGTGSDIVAYRVISEPSKKLDTYSEPQAALQAQVGGDHYNGIEKQFALDLIKLLSALESWSFSHNQSMPDYLMDECERMIEGLSKIVLEDAK